MKTLSQVVNAVTPLAVLNGADTALQTIACRPEETQPNCFYCIIEEFLEYSQWKRGADLLPCVPPHHIAALLTTQPRPEFPLPQLIVADARRATACAAKFFFDQPDEALRLIGVTGTNGKTTVTQLIYQWLITCGEPAAALGTLGLQTSTGKRQDTIYTTPLAPALFGILNKLQQTSIATVAMEISSHALALDRVFGLDTDIAVFTNLSRDHLDFHGSMENYRAAKLALFERLKPEALSIVNVDDPVGRQISALSPCPVLTFGLSPSAHLRAIHTDYSLQGTQITVTYQGETVTFTTRLVGPFNVSNVLAALAACLACGATLRGLAATSMTLRSIPGRLETIPLGEGRLGIVDYSHTPDALEKALQTLRTLNPGRIITVFGCGGNRDKGKRPLMGAVAAQNSDLCVVTSDNPRREDPLSIIDNILAGMPEQGIMIEPDRGAAIRQAVALSRAGDVILVAGKGHEPYQIIGDQKLPFNDYEKLKSLCE
jgi:UDP-N-acetylmuramoyl-L-alanyl-D-glutamate--2,6-diaminopimelate ligase